jgi:predicted ATPase
MAIQQLDVRGFKSLQHVTWQPSALNIVVGPNGSGKSNLIRLLELISHTANRGLRNWIEKSDGMVPLLWDHRPGTFGWKVRIDPIDAPRDRVRDALTFEMELAQAPGAESAYEIRKDTLGSWFKFDQGLERSPYWIYQRDAHRAVLYDQKQGKLVPLVDYYQDPDELDAGPDESLLSQISDNRNRIPALARRVIGAWAIHHDIHVDRDSAIRHPATAQHTTRLSPDGSNLAPFLHTNYSSNRSFREQIDDGMRAGFGDQYDKLNFPPSAASQIELAVSWKSSSTAHVARDLSDGTLRFLVILSILANPDPPPLIVIDEPEVGLHPSMLSVVSEYAIAASERTQVVITSHSPEFLDSFSDYSPCVTLCHWEDGGSQLLTLDQAMLEKWLSSYRLGRMFTQGELENLAMPSVDVIDDLDARLSVPPPDSSSAP